MKIGMFKAMRLCKQYNKLKSTEQAQVRRSRLEKLVSWAKDNSPVYANLYKGLSAQFTMADLPPMNKAELMPQFDRWITDSSVKLMDIERFMKNPDNIGRKYDDRYLVFTTSGSTGNPLTVLCDKTTYNVMGAINTIRSFARKEDMKSFVMRGGKSMGVFATGGFYLSNSSVRARLLAMPWKKRKFGVISALSPTPEIVQSLNQFQPAMLGGYPSSLDLLVEEQEKGHLNIAPVLIMTGGEYLSDTVRQNLQRAFGCWVQTSYACTEAGTIACECTENHFHINEDWVIVEPVDDANNPVPDGVQASKILITNLFNYTQPFIRYEITDRVVMHHTPCPCGKPSPWLTVEGRTDDMLHFDVAGQSIKIPPLAIYATLIKIKSVRRFQLVAHPGNIVELRIVPADGYNTEAAFACAKDVLIRFLADHCIREVTILLSNMPPQQQSGSGKYKHIAFDSNRYKNE